MKSFALLLAAAAVSANPLAAVQPSCNADNCARAVTGTIAKPALATRQADCSSFMLATVTPAPTTSTMYETPSAVTSTTTVIITTETDTITETSTSFTTTFIGETITNAKRSAPATAITNSPSSVPTYATACSGTARYSSACSCFGFTKTTTTAATPTLYTTVTVETPTSISTIFSTSTVLTTETAVATSIVTVTPGDRPACGSTVRGTGPCECTYTVTCGMKYTGSNIITTVSQVSEMGCINACDGFDNCFNADYSRSTGVCRIFRRADGSEGGLTNDDIFGFAGSCLTNGGAPGCVIG